MQVGKFVASIFACMAVCVLILGVCYSGVKACCPHRFAPNPAVWGDSRHAGEIESGVAVQLVPMSVADDKCELDLLTLWNNGQVSVALHVQKCQVLLWPPRRR